MGAIYRLMGDAGAARYGLLEGVVTPTPTPTPKRVRFALYLDDAGTIPAAAGPIEYAVFDQLRPSLFTAPVAKGASAIAAGGVVDIDVTASTAAIGGAVWLDLSNSDGSPATRHAGYSGPVPVVAA